MLDDGWTYLLVKVHGRVMVSVALGLSFLATSLAVFASACFGHGVWVRKLFAGEGKSAL